jgi:putative endonuclease
LILVTRKKIGDRGEENAVNFLLANGYKILARNYRFGKAEIDIIASTSSIIVFVEVKSRKNTLFGHPETFLSDAQQERIHLAAEEYILQNKWQGEIRFDIIAILWARSEPSLDHFEDAF